MEAVESYTVTDARKRLGDIVTKVNRSGINVRFSRHSEVVGVIPGRMLDVLENAESLQQWVAFGFVEHFFKSAPEHIKNAQLGELKKLPIDKLKHLLDIKSLPLKATQRKNLFHLVGADIIERIEKRFKVCKVISEAEKDGLYEAAEHMTGMIDLT